MESKKLLVVEDMQRDFVDGALGTKEAAAVVNGIVQKVAAAEKVVFTFDTHGETYLNTQEGKNLPVEHCISGTDGHRLVPELEQYQDSGLCIKKGTFGSTELGRYVAEQFAQGAIDSVELVGVCTDICVISNAMLIKAFCPEIPVTVDAACCAGVTPESHRNALCAMQVCQIGILNME